MILSEELLKKMVNATALTDFPYAEMLKIFTSHETLRAQVQVLERGLEKIAEPDQAHPEENLYGWLNAWRNITKQEARKVLESSRKLGQT